MNKLIILLTALLSCNGVLAQTEMPSQTEFPASVDRSVTAKEVLAEINHQEKPSRFTFGASYRFSLGLLEHSSTKFGKQPVERGNSSPDDMKGGAFLLSLGYNITNHWAATLEFGLASYAGITIAPLGLKAQHFYGHKPNRWFNYVNVDAMFDTGHIGVLGGLGAGYRIKLGGRSCLDFSVGYEIYRVSSQLHESVLDDASGEWKSVQIRFVNVRHGITFGAGFVF